jgi:hypothetical protein
MIHKTRLANGQYGIATTTPIEKGTLLFSYQDWIEDEQRGWQLLTVDELWRLEPRRRTRFLRYAYDVDFGLIIGTTRWSQARHVSNFMNHSCDPNMVYGDGDTILARREIEAGEELRIDYGNFIVNVDQGWSCRCGASTCRRRIRKDDWRALALLEGFGFPSFMQESVVGARTEGAAPALVTRS